MGGLIAATVLVLVYICNVFLFSPSKEYIPYGTPQVVVVTVLDEATMSTNYRSHVVENRNYYAEKQGSFFHSRFDGHYLTALPRLRHFLPQRD